MALGTARNIYSLVGQICVNPTDLTQPFPHGGKAIGLVRNGIFRINPSYEEITAEEFGGTVVDYVRAVESAVLVAVLREFDADAIGAILPNTRIGSSSGRRMILGEITSASISGIPVRPGSLASDKSSKVLFSPRAVDYHPAIILYNAIPLVDRTAELQLSIGSEAGIAVMWQATPRASDFQIYQVGLLEDINL